MIAKHTPGPWTRIVGERFRHDQSAGVTAPDGNYIACALDRNRFELDEEVEANARLIAAAPELLDALEQAVQLLDNIDGRPLANGVLLSYTQDLPGFRATIAKARGD